MTDRQSMEGQGRRHERHGPADNCREGPGVVPASFVRGGMAVCERWLAGAREDGAPWDRRAVSNVAEKQILGKELELKWENVDLRQCEPACIFMPAGVW